jgi:hypothetical protein
MKATVVCVLTVAALAAGAGSSFARDTSPRERADVQGMISGGTDVRTPEKRTRVAEVLANTFSRGSAQIHGSLRELHGRPGNGMYFEVQQADGTRPSIVLEPEAGSIATLHVNGTMTVDLSGEVRGAEGAMAVFWVHSGTQPEYRLTIPPSVTHVTLVVNGRAIASAQRFGRTRTVRY